MEVLRLGSGEVAWVMFTGESRWPTWQWSNLVFISRTFGLQNFTMGECNAWWDTDGGKLHILYEVNLLFYINLDFFFPVPFDVLTCWRVDVLMCWRVDTLKFWTSTCFEKTNFSLFQIASPTHTWRPPHHYSAQWLTILGLTSLLLVPIFPF